MADTLETYRTVTPYPVVPDADAELKFVTAAFGATESLCHRDDKNAVMHAEFKIGDSLMMLGQAGDQMKTLSAALTCGSPTSTTSTPKRWPQVRNRSARPKTNPTVIATLASLIASASPGGSDRP